MDRLTQRKNGKPFYPACFEEPCNGMGCKIKGCQLDEEVCKTLAAYEDTGLEPAAVKDMAENAETMLLTWFEAKYGFPVGVLMDLCEAKQDGRVLVTPCKPGETVYRIWKTQGRVPTITEHYMTDWGMVVRWMHKFGNTVFLTHEEAEEALAKEAE